MFLTTLLFISFITIVPVQVLSGAAFNDTLRTCPLNYTCCGNICIPYESNCDRKKWCCKSEAYITLDDVMQSSKCHNISCNVENSNNGPGSILLCNSTIYGKTRVTCLCYEESLIVTRDPTTSPEAPLSKLSTTTRPSGTANITTDSTNFNRKQFGATLLGPLLFFPFMCILIVIARGMYFSKRSRNRRSATNRTQESLSQQARGSNNSAVAPVNEQHTRAGHSNLGFLSELSHNPIQPPSYDYVISQGNSLSPSGAQHQTVSLFTSSNAVNVLHSLPPAYDEIVGQNVNDNEGYLPSYEEATTDHRFDS